MKQKLLLVVLVLAFAFGAVGPALAHSLPPCADAGEPGHSDYARHHVSALAMQGDLGRVDHDGDGMAHVPGAHRGYSLCNPSGK